MRKLKNILISGIMSVCMVVTSLPATVFAQEVETVQEIDSVQVDDTVQDENVSDRQENTQNNVQYELISFAELPESVKNQNVALGTNIEDIELPETLTASYHSFKEKPEDNSGDKDNEKNPEEDSGDEGGEKDPEDNTGDEGGEKDPEDNTGDEDEEKRPEDNTGDEDEEKNPEIPPEDEGNDNESEDYSETQDGKSEAESVVSETEYTGKAEPTVKEETVEVHMKEYNAQPEDMDAPKTLVSEGSETKEDSDSGLGEETEPESGSDANLSEETSPEADTNKDKNEGNVQGNSIETIIIENITWISTPAYDADVEGIYIFTPVIAKDYVLAEDAALPEIIVTVGEAEEPEFSEEAEEPVNDVVEAPACGIISSDTVWEGSGTLSDGELIVESGVTLTINDAVNISGKVTIKGGGTIKRGSYKGHFSVESGADFTVGEITLEGDSISESYSMIAVNNASVTLDDGCRIQNCNKRSYIAPVSSGGGAALFIYQGEAVLNNVTIENCSGPGLGGAIYLESSTMTVNGGTYKNNKDKEKLAGQNYAVGSVIYSFFSSVYICGGRFIDNMAYGNIESPSNSATVRGCIVNQGGDLHLCGGYFEGNKSDSATSEFGKGAIAFGSRSGYDTKDTIIEISGDVQFCGDGVEGSGTDGFFLDNNSFPRKVHIGSPLVSPVYFYLYAEDGYVIAEGSNGYKLTEKDLKLVHFTDIGDSGKQWYAWLDEEKNEIYLAQKVSAYGLYVYYSSNGAKGTVEDNTEYASGTDVTVKSAEPLSKEGYVFKEWNTKPDGSGTAYIPGTTFKITSDITLYAIFEEGRNLTTDFYSGEADRKETITKTLAAGADSVTITTPELMEMDDWTRLGWNADKDGYTGSIAAGTQLAVSKDSSYYGVYKRNVTLSYDANGWGTAPEEQNDSIYANVHNSISYKSAQFAVAPDIIRRGYRFLGWSLTRDGHDPSGSAYYRLGDNISAMDNMTLYAQMIDDIAPVLGEASYNSGYKDIENWLVRKKDLVITVPITEEGSGVNKIVYTFTPEKGESVTGEALMQDAYVPRQVRQAAVVQLDVSGGKMSVISQDTTVDEQPKATGGQVGTTDGQIQARITISEDYKGTVYLKCIDNAGNESLNKLLTATGGGVIVEDNAPQISFINKDIKSSKTVVTVFVSDEVDADKSSQITGGIASITYQIDNKQEQNVTAKNFEKEIVPSCEFNVDVSGSGEHTLKVSAVDNAGNESQQSTKVIITAPNKKTSVIKQNNSNPPTEEKKEFVSLVKVTKPEPPKDSEPATGDDSLRVEVYATIAMISGLLYILLYFITGPNGMTEEEKNETVARILNWAKKGGRCRRFAAIAVIFCVLFYYHSIGKRVNVEWNEVVSS